MSSAPVKHSMSSSPKNSLGPRVGDKRKASPTPEPARKVVRGGPRDFGLAQILESTDIAQPLVTRHESPCDTFREVFCCDLAGPVSMVVYRSRPSRVMAIRTFTQNRTDQMLEIFRNIQHENILSAIECYKDGETVYFRFDDFPVTLEHLVACDAYPTETQLALILSQLLQGLSHLLKCGLAHQSLICSNILLSWSGILKIAGLEHCIEHLPGQSQAPMMNALATIAMELMQNYDKDDGLRGIDDVNRWPVESWPFKFLEATTTAVSVEQLKHHIHGPAGTDGKGELQWLARFALVSARTFYTYKT
ncbi:hypothetical protein MPDQ_004948 [Monascus purpureus]|uniref:Protein kinase domain-containing protein n=1 Tax=Monascus purpureus TaxID=5098 RepID=A0A507QIN7_MONPU|nr:hypothetical protein MPDQ_004948 [Monascus purpureus]BDD61486.1 hypothetical protein MAP00_006529 [Monascus purpureus]